MKLKIQEIISSVSYANIKDTGFKYPNILLKEFAKYVNLREYRDWRLTGIAFETRLATGTIPNRTLGSYIEGKSVSFYLLLINFMIYRKKEMIVFW